MESIPNITKISGVSQGGKKMLDLVVAFLEMGRPVVAPPGLSLAKAQFLTDAIKRA